MNAVPCKGCGREIVFAKTAEGKTIPLERRTTGAYRITSALNDQKVTCERVGDVWISHFVTCPDANRFSGRHKK